MDPKNSGDPCPKCNTPLIERAEQFYWRGEFFPGLVCVSCNALWDGGAFMGAVSKTTSGWKWDEEV